MQEVSHSKESPVDVHNNAHLTPRGRATMVAYVCDYGWSRRATAYAFRTTTRTVSRWVARFEADGHAGLHDRRSRPRRQPSCTPRRLQRQVRALRRQRWTLQRIAAFVGVSRATVGRILVRAGLNRLSELEAQEPPQRYEHEAPGDLLHLDIKRLLRFHQPGHRVTGVPRGATTARQSTRTREAPVPSPICRRLWPTTLDWG